MSYIITAQTTIDYNDLDLISELYSKGFVFTRIGKGVMQQTRSLRIDLAHFELNSENRRILRKNEDLFFDYKILPLKNYNWTIHKMGKDFYSNKFGMKTMTASKIKEMFNEMEKSNMNGAFQYKRKRKFLRKVVNNTNLQPIGYCLCYENDDLLHYSYPFYNLNESKNTGLGMMLLAINWAKENNKRYIYLGSAKDSSSKYKLQFTALEWWDNSAEKWSKNIQELKDILS